MSIGLEFPLYNGVEPTWADVSVLLSGTEIPLLDMKDIKEINTASTVTIGKGEGASGGRKTKRGSGSVDNTASIVLYRSGWNKLLRAAVKARTATRRGGQAAVSLVVFDMSVKHVPPGSLEQYEVRVRGARLAGREIKHAEGTELETVTVPLDVFEIVDVVDGVEVAML